MSGSGPSVWPTRRKGGENGLPPATWPGLPWTLPVLSTAAATAASPVPSSSSILPPILPRSRRSLRPPQTRRPRNHPPPPSSVLRQPSPRLRRRNQGSSRPAPLLPDQHPSSSKPAKTRMGLVHSLFSGATPRRQPLLSLFGRRPPLRPLCQPLSLIPPQVVQ